MLTIAGVAPFDPRQFPAVFVLAFDLDVLPRTWHFLPFADVSWRALRRARKALGSPLAYYTAERCTSRCLETVPASNPESVISRSVLRIARAAQDRELPKHAYATRTAATRVFHFLLGKVQGPDLLIRRLCRDRPQPWAYAL